MSRVNEILKRAREREQRAIVAARPVATATPLEPAGLARILKPQTGGYQWLMPQIAAITPQYLQMVLMAAAQGSHVQQAALFRMMLDTWPELAACVQEVYFGVLRKKLIVEPYHEEDDAPTDTAVERSKVVGAALKAFRPDPAADENDFDGTIRDIVNGWFCGVTVLEVAWQNAQTPTLGQFMAPRATWWADPSVYALGRDGSLGLNSSALVSGSLQGTQGNVIPFPEHKFLIGINKTQSGMPFGSAMLRALAWWWCAANFSADWLLNLAQVFGLPFRWANYEQQAPAATVEAICNMLQNMGSAGWAAFPQGTTLEMKEAGKGSDHSPQGELLDRADRYARLLILGQTMTGGSGTTGKGGGQAFGTVEKTVKDDRIDACGKYACTVINHQLVRSILTLTYGDDSELPAVRLLEEEEGDLTEAQRDQALANAGLKIGVNFLRKKYGIPEPGEDEETIGGVPEEKPETGKLKPETNPAEEESMEAALARIAGIEDEALFASELKKLSEEIK